jgi:hypothetical protein
LTNRLSFLPNELVLSVLSPFREKRPPGNPLLRRGVQPPWLKPFNKGRKPGSRNKPRPPLPELIELRLLEVTEADVALLEDPLRAEELAELTCHLLDIRRQRPRWLKHVRRYQPWRLADGFIRPVEKGPAKPQRVVPEDPVPLEDPDEESPSFSFADFGIDPAALRRSLR